MFTGIVEDVGEVVDLAATPAGYRLQFRTGLSGDLHDGDSVAVNGVCLTVVRVEGSVVQADIGPETARITTLSRLAAGAGVNLERPLRLDARLGGHLVQGHVDGLGRVEVLREAQDTYWLGVSFPAALAPYLIRKGSIAVDGVSLTIADLQGDQFGVQLIPFTWTHTTFARMRTGDAVNLECDMIGKYVARALEVARPPRE